MLLRGQLDRSKVHVFSLLRLLNISITLNCYRHLVNCVAKKFQSMVNAKSSLESQLFYDFLRLANGLGPLIGLTVSYESIFYIEYSRLGLFISIRHIDW